MKIAKTAALILAMAPFLAVAQRPDGRLDRKPSPATSASSVTSSAQATPSAQSAIAPYHGNSGSSAPISPQAAAARPVTAAPLARPIPTIPAQPVAPQPAPTSVATAATIPLPQPVVSRAPSPEPMAAVNYAQGQLTVVSQSASLETVLKMISAKTGAVIDVAPELQNEPVIAQIGPSAVRDVM